MTETVELNAIAFVRSGDKGNDADVSIFARTQAAYPVLLEQVTAERVAALYGDMMRGTVTRWEVANVWALKFLLRDALGGGGPSSLRADNLGKALAGAVLRLSVEVPAELLAAIGDVRAPADPYAGADWRV